MAQDLDSLLIVDDEAAVRDVMLRYFSKRGLNAFAEGSGRSALDWIRSHRVDIVLLDIEMPEMDGLELLRILRKYYSPSQLPVIMVTGRAGRDDVEAARTAGANDYILKPINFPLLLDRIHTQLSQKHATEASFAGKRSHPFGTPDTNSSMRE